MKDPLEGIDIKITETPTGVEAKMSWVEEIPQKNAKEYEKVFKQVKKEKESNSINSDIKTWTDLFRIADKE